MTDPEDRLEERRARAKGLTPTEATDTLTVTQPVDEPGNLPCGYCYAQPGEPCVTMTKGEVRDTYHAARREFVEVPRHEEHTNRLTEAGVLEFHARDVRPDRMADQLFYLRSRGIPKTDAILLSLDAAPGEDVGHFTPDPDAEWTETRWRLEAAGLSPAEKEDILDEFHTLAREVRP